MKELNNTLAEKKKSILVIIIIVILVSVLGYFFVTYRNMKRTKSYEAMERELFVATKKYLEKEKIFDNNVVFSVDVGSSKLLEDKYLKELVDPVDKNKSCKAYVNVTRENKNDYEYIVLLECSQYNNGGIKFDRDGTVLESNVYGSNLPNIDDFNTTGNDDKDSDIDDDTDNTIDNDTNNDVDNNTSNNSSNDNTGASNNTNNGSNTSGSSNGTLNNGQQVLDGFNVNGRIIKIIDRSSVNCAQAIEYYYEDSNYKYYFNCIMSPSVFVVIDGIEYNLKIALNNGFVTMEELEEAGFRPLKESKNLVDR